MPPIYQPEVVAAAVLHCAERPQRELPVTWAAQKLLWGQKLSPRAGDLVLLRNGWEGQQTRAHAARRARALRRPRAHLERVHRGPAAAR